MAGITRTLARLFLLGFCTAQLAVWAPAVAPKVYAADGLENHNERLLQKLLEDEASAVGPGGTAKGWQLFRADDFLALPDYQRELYVAGLNDAYNWSYSGGFARMKWLSACVHGRKAPQLTAMFGKWLKRYPERWHEPAAKLFPFAIFELCRAARRPLGASGAKGPDERK